MTTIRTTTETTGTVTTEIELVSVGQQNPDDGDDVIVRARIHLPTDGASIKLHPDVRFGHRCYVLGEPLRDWGELIVRGDKRTRSLLFEVHATTWAAARAEALDSALKETAKLHAMLRARTAALAAAGEP